MYNFHVDKNLKNNHLHLSQYASLPSINTIPGIMIEYFNTSSIMMTRIDRHPYIVISPINFYISTNNTKLK